MKIGDSAILTVVEVCNYGMFVKNDQISGFVHISEISDHFIKNIRSLYHVGDQITAKLIAYNYKSGYAKFSIKELQTYKKRKYVRVTKQMPLQNYGQGFALLKQKLPVWIEQTIEQIDK